MNLGRGKQPYTPATNQGYTDRTWYDNSVRIGLWGLPIGMLQIGYNLSTPNI